MVFQKLENAAFKLLLLSLSSSSFDFHVQDSEPCHALLSAAQMNRTNFRKTKKIHFLLKRETSRCFYFISSPKPGGSSVFSGKKCHRLNGTCSGELLLIVFRFAAVFVVDDDADVRRCFDDGDDVFVLLVGIDDCREGLLRLEKILFHAAGN